MVERVCVTCGCCINHRGKKAIYCSIGCKSKQEWSVKKKTQGKVNDNCKQCGLKFTRSSNVQSFCSSRCRIMCYKDKSSLNNKNWKTRNKEKVIEYRNSKQGAKTMVRGDLRFTLGFEPPADLVEEATALRILNRALRNIS